jgi:single-strand selective monofunctional uracil DNA glycosylase
MDLFMAIATQLISAAAQLRDVVDPLTFSAPVTHVYNPLVYAWEPHERYLSEFGNSTKKVVFLGMNPGPFGMAQTGVPFGEIPAVQDWMKIDAPVGKPDIENAKRPVDGFDCKRSEVSGRRLWGLMADRFGSAENFFENHMVLNYCPLVFMEESGRNVTPDKILAAEKQPLNEACDAHLREVTRILEPEWCIGVGAYAKQCFERVVPNHPKIGTILHPSPASPAANRGWPARPAEQLEALGVW